MVTTDGGQSWKEQQSGINTTIKAIDFFNATIGVAISETDEILITHTGGETWKLLEKVKNPNPEASILLWDVVTCDEETAWVLGNMGIFFKVDFPNQNWTFISEVSLYLFRLAMVNNSHGWATGGYGTIVKTTDGWQSYEIQDAGVETSFRGIFFWDVHKGWIVGAESIILATTDGGQHWRMQYKYRPLLEGFLGGYTSLTDIFFKTELQGWAVGSWGIHFTENGGASWFHFPNTSGPNYITFANRSHGWAVETRKNRSYMTTIGGTLPISESTINFGVFVITLSGALTLILVMNVVNRLQEHQDIKFLDKTDSD